MPQFLFLGDRWINVDKITFVEFVPANMSGKLCAKVHYGAATASVRLNESDSEKLVEYLQKHSAES
jgi:hypothetical protein